MHGARETTPHCSVTPCGIKPQSKRAQRELGLGESGWSARLTRGEQLNQKGVVRVKGKEADYLEYLRRMDGGRDMRPGSCAHPGTNAGPMHAGIVMRRMLKFMRNRAAGRHGQQDNDGEGNDPNDASEERNSHRIKTNDRLAC